MVFDNIFIQRINNNILNNYLNFNDIKKNLVFFIMCLNIKKIEYPTNLINFKELFNLLIQLKLK